MKKSLAFIWENFGPIHVDRCVAVAMHFQSEYSVVGIELLGASPTYNWEPSRSALLGKITLFPAGYPRIGRLPRVAWAVVQACLSVGRAAIFVCHYEDPAIWVAALVLRLCGRRVFVMNNSKFNDKERRPFRELVKVLALFPYSGALTAATQSHSYLRFLGMPQSKIQYGYNTLSVERIRHLSGSLPAPGGVSFKSRHFSIVARLEPKKNLFLALEAYRQYTDLVKKPRPLHIAGYGALESQLRKEAIVKGLAERVVFRGALQIEEVSRMLASTLALILPSTEEQFGNVVIEAQAMGLPVVISDACGAGDKLVRSGVNGFVVEADNPDGFAYFMSLLAEDESLWNHMCLAAQESVKLGDAVQFARGVGLLVNGTTRGSVRD